MNSLGLDKIKDEIIRCDEVLQKYTDKKIELFRPPYGEYNNNVVSVAEQNGKYVIQWDVDSLDWKPGITQQTIMERIMKRVKSGSILLFHNDTPHTAKMLPTIILALKEQGYSFTPVSELILREGYTIDVEGRQKHKE